MAVNTFIKCSNPNIIGESLFKGLEGQIEVHTWGFAVTQPSAPGGTLQKVQPQRLKFTKDIDSSSDDLLKMSFTAKPIGKVELSCFRPSGDGGANTVGVLYLKITLEQVIVSSYASESSNGGIATDSIELSYAKITFAYTRSGGQVEVISYDARNNVVA